MASQAECESCFRANVLIFTNIFSCDVIEAISFEAETATWLKFRDETETSSKTPRPRFETWSSRLRPRLKNLCIFLKLKKMSSLLTSFFFNFLAFVWRVLVVSYLQIQQTQNHWTIQILINHFFAIFQVSRPETFETKTETPSLIFRCSG